MFVSFLGVTRYQKYFWRTVHILQSLHWPNTVRLTLGVQHPSDLWLLLQRDALPIIEHLEVTIETSRWLLPLSLHNLNISDIDIDGTRLQSLLLRFIPLDYLIRLMDTLDLPSLKKLTLIDSSDHSKSASHIFFSNDQV